MRITSTDIWTVVVPCVRGRVQSEAYGTSSGLDELPKQIIRVNTDEGYYGIGETRRDCPRDVVEQLAQALIGKDPRKILIQQIPAAGPVETDSERASRSRWWEWQPAGPASRAYSAFECAILDILGKLYDQPVHLLLGGAVRDKVRCDYWIGSQTPEDAARSAKIAAERGFTGMKMKCTIDEPMVERCQAIWDAVGSDFRLTIDPNERFYRLSEALALARELAGRGHVECFEDPMLKWDIEAYRLFRQAGVVPVALHLSNPHDIISAIKHEAVDYLNLGGSDYHHLGGSMLLFVRNAHLAHAASIPVWHGSSVDLGILEFAYIHAAAVARNCVLGSDLVGSWTREDDLILNGVTFDGEYALVPQTPGLGCELDMDALEKYRIA